MRAFAPHSVAQHSRGVGAVKGARDMTMPEIDCRAAPGRLPLDRAASEPRLIIGYRMMRLSICTRGRCAVRLAHRETCSFR